MHQELNRSLFLRKTPMVNGKNLQLKQLTNQGLVEKLLLPWVHGIGMMNYVSNLNMKTQVARFIQVIPIRLA